MIVPLPIPFRLSRTRLMVLLLLAGCAGLANAAAGDYFGEAVSLSGDELAITSATTTQVYARTGGLWVLQATLPFTGATVAITDHRLAIGALGGGTVVLYALVGGGWVADGEVDTSDALGFSTSLGNTIALSGDTLAVGANNIAVDQTPGVVDIYQRSGPGAWDFAQRLSEPSTGFTDPDAGPESSYGWSLALQADTLVVGALGFPTFVYHRDAGLWTNQGVLSAPPAVDALPGWSVALDGDLVAVGSNDGPVDLYRRTGTAWAHEATIPIISPASHPCWAVQVSGDRLAVFGLGGFTAFFQHVGATWVAQGVVSTPGATDNYYDGFLEPIALSGNTFICGVPGSTSNGSVPISASGGVAVYTGSGSAWTLPVRISAVTVTTDIGAAHPETAAASGDASTFTVAAGGSVLFGAADEFRFVAQALPGDGEIRAHVVLSATQPFAKAGLMLRDGSAPGARNVLFAFSRGYGVVLQVRNQTGGPTVNRAITAPAVGAAWLRLVRRGDTVTASSSLDGSTWTVAGQVVVQLDRPLAAGAAVCGPNGATPAVGSFAGLQVVPYGLAAPFTTRVDLGAALTGTGAESLGGLTTVAGGGADLGGTSDGGEFLTGAAVSGDFDLHAQVVYQRGTDGAAKAGIMARAGTGAAAANLFVGLTPSHGGNAQRRTALGGTTATIGRSNNTAQWYRLTRTVSTVTAYWSNDGVTWNAIGTAVLPGPLRVGLAVSSHDPAHLGVATFANVVLTTPTPAPPLPRAIN